MNLKSANLRTVNLYYFVLKYCILFLIFTLFIFPKSIVLADSAITEPELEAIVTFLASDSLKGRKPGAPENAVTVKYILDQLPVNAVKMGDNGLQYFDLVTDIKSGDSNKLVIKNRNAELFKDYTPLSFSESSELNADAAFAGYGMSFNTDSLQWDDYAGIDVTSKWVMILPGDPEMDNPNSIFANYSDLRQKTLTAKDHGAAGVIFVSGEEFDKKDELVDLSFDKSEATGGIPVIQIKREWADTLLYATGKTINALEKQINSQKKSASIPIPERVYARTDVAKVYATTENVVAMMPGSDPMVKDRIIVIGAHYDHLGFGGPGSGSRQPDTLAVHNGADDNASGVAAALEIFNKLAAEAPAKSILFIAFAGEEMGRLGSRYFVDHPLVDLRKIDIMFNLDMVGRLDSARTLEISGAGTALGLDSLLQTTDNAFTFNKKVTPDGYGPSDHASFYGEKIPVLTFFTGVHDDYHTPRDDADRINYQGLKDISGLVYTLVKSVAARDQPLIFQEAGPKSGQSLRKRFRVTLGIVPDHTADVKGLRVDGVINGRPADIAGIRKGDIITAIQGKSVTNIYDYMYRLAELKSGENSSVEILRDNVKIILIVEL